MTTSGLSSGAFPLSSSAAWKNLLPGISGGKGFSGSYSGFTPSNTKLPFSVKGIDFTTGKPVDLAQFVTPSFGVDGVASQTQPSVFDTAQAIPSTTSIADEYAKFYERMAPLQRQQRIEEAQLAAGLTRQQLSDVMPYLSAAGAEATARSLAASEKFRAFKEQMPSSVQDIMASKQGQVASAADAEYRRALGMAAQQQAAKDFAGKFAGQYISVS